MFEAALVTLGRFLQGADYRFITITPETHARVLARTGAQDARSLRDVFGWSRPFRRGLLPEALEAALLEAGVVEAHERGLRSTVRFSSLSEGLYAHSAYPTSAEDAVFFGPDTYRYCALLARTIAGARRVVDVGCGSGAGGLSIAKRVGDVVLADISDRALSFARANAALMGLRTEVVRGDVLASIEGDFDMVIANPPYLVDSAHRTYRDGGEHHGTALGLRIVREASTRLPRGGRLVLYTGAPVIDGTDVFLREASALLESAGASFSYEEIDPDVFGDELTTPSYATVERIAAVALVATIRR